MKKKNLLLIAGAGAVIVLAVVLLLVFLGGSDAPQATMLDGTWKVVAVVEDGKVDAPEKDFFTFAEGSAKIFRSSDALTPYSSSSYTFRSLSESQWELNLPGISRTYTVTVFTDNFIRLHDGDNTYRELIRYANDDMSSLKFNPDLLSGSWDVVCGDAIGQSAYDRLVFSGELLIQYPAGGGNPFASACSWEGENLCFDGLTLQYYPLNEEVVLLVHRATGSVWELHKTAPSYTEDTDN